MGEVNGYNGVICLRIGVSHYNFGNGRRFATALHGDKQLRSIFDLAAKRNNTTPPVLLSNLYLGHDMLILKKFSYELQPLPDILASHVRVRIEYIIKGKPQLIEDAGAYVTSITIDRASDRTENRETVRVAILGRQHT